MYGEETLNNHAILNFSLTKEFFETFSSLKHLQIELPLVLVRYFHSYIRDHVSENQSNQRYVSAIQNKHLLFTMKEVQQTLARSPKVERNLSAVPHRNMIILPASMVTFAMKQLSQHKVLLMIGRKDDQKYLENIKLPNNIQVFDFYHHLRKEQVPKVEFSDILLRANLILNNNQLNPIFKTDSFKEWLMRHLNIATRIVSTLEKMVRRFPIKVIIDQAEIINPGTALSLLSQKFNLPFIHIPHLLYSDRTLIPTRASHYCAWGKNYKNWLQKRGIPSTSIYETGNISFEYKARSQISKAKLLQEFNIPSHHKIITYTTQPFQESVNAMIVNWINKALKPEYPITVVVCSHPGDKIDYNNYIKNQKNMIVSPAEYNLYNILTNTDLVMTISSTTSVEAAMLGKGLLVLQPPIPYHYELQNNNFHSHLVRAGAGPPITNANQLSNVFTKMMNASGFLNVLSNQSQSFLRDTIHSSGRPSVLVRRIIVNALKEVRK
ncbi:hypothetical protein [Alteribacter populi]|uniref:hypothetical protein n=1 Tax=Alteribacter populi TaxID=2011011 RepID=UPI000BBAAC50|nr:hypothetical protein [Alteribacter populi]